MKNLFLSGIFLAAAQAFAEEAPAMHTFRVQKMMCGSCTARVKKSITAHPGISDVIVDLGSGEARFRCDTKVSSCDLAPIKKDLARIGFPVR